jgi:hypothetical protein
MKTINGLFILIALYLTGCETSFEQLERSLTQDEIAEAKHIFQEKYVNGSYAGAIRKVALNADVWETDLHAGYKLLSGDFIPQWHNAQIDEGVITLKTLSEVSYFAATYSDVNLSLSQTILVSQKMTIDIRQSSCIISYEIPDYDSRFEASFSGVIIYQTLSDEIIRVERYKNGALIESAERTLEESLLNFQNRAYEITGNIAIIRTTSMRTRANQVVNNLSPPHPMSDAEAEQCFNDFTAGGGDDGVVNFDTILQQSVTGLQKQYFYVSIGGNSVYIRHFSVALTGSSYSIYSSPYKTETFTENGQQYYRLYYQGPTSGGQPSGLMTLGADQYNKLPSNMK